MIVAQTVYICIRKMILLYTVSYNSTRREQMAEKVLIFGKAG